MNTISSSQPTSKTSLCYPHLGFGLGLRTPHYDYILEHKPKVDWFEIISEDFFVEGGRPLYYLEKIRELYPVVMHGVSMSIGSTDPIKWDYLKQLKALAQRIDAAWISDHLCWTGLGGVNLHDLLPLPYTEAGLKHLVSRIKQVQDFLEQRIVLENPSTYTEFKSSTIKEWNFLQAVAEEADCLILLDVNNVYVSAYNHGFDPKEYIGAIDANRVQQFHIAGHTNLGDYIVDTHDHDVIDEVWSLYEFAVQRFGAISTLLERDDHIPEFPELFAELQFAKRLALQTIADPIAEGCE